MDPEDKATHPNRVIDLQAYREKHYPHEAKALRGSIKAVAKENAERTEKDEDFQKKFDVDL